MISKILTSPYLHHGAETTVYFEIERFINEVLLGREYDEFIKDSPIFQRNDLVIVDLGCNIGSFSLSMYDKAKKIYAVDFVKDCVNIFQKTIEENHLDTIDLSQAAISITNGKTTASKLNGTDGGNALNTGTEEVETITLATYFKNRGITDVDLMKVDVEGSEGRIFQAEDFPSLREHIKLIVGEYHTEDVRPIFEKLDMKCTILPGRHFIAWYEGGTSNQEL